MRKSLVVSAIAISLISIGVFATPIFDDSVHPDFGSGQPTQELLFKKSNNTSSSGNMLFGQQGSIMKVNLSCGLRPLAPLGCQVGPCTCDQNGNNCQWTFICR
jgi:hypothetical protein